MGERSSNYTIGNVMHAFGTVSPKNLNDDKLDSEAYFSNLSLSTVVLQTGPQGGWEQSNITIKDLIVYYQNLFQDSICHRDGERGRPEKPTGRTNYLWSRDIQEVYRGCGNQSAGHSMITKSTQGFSLRLRLNKRDWPRISILHSLSWMCVVYVLIRETNIVNVNEFKIVFYDCQIILFFCV